MTGDEDRDGRAITREMATKEGLMEGFRVKNGQNQETGTEKGM